MCKFECFGSWQAVVLSCLVMSVMSGVQLLLTLVVIVALLVTVFGAHSELTVPMSGIRIVWYNLCVTCFMVSLIISPWSMSKSELDWVCLELLASGVLQCIVGEMFDYRCQIII